MNITYRKAELSDIEQITNLRLKLLEFYNGDVVYNTQNLREYTIEYFKKHLNDDMIYFIALDEYKIIATCAITIEESLPRPRRINGIVGKIGQVYTLDDYRKKGIQKVLLNMALEHGKCIGCEVYHLNATNPEAINLYKKIGFVELNDAFEKQV